MLPSVPLLLQVALGKGESKATVLIKKVWKQLTSTQDWTKGDVGRIKSKLTKSADVFFGLMYVVK